ncbi:HIT family protein [Kocuria sabuli]|uniref:HIT family protein n=1 Tax=Kocuria sabuli TaxID=3071448 RepID=UPI0034D49188
MSECRFCDLSGHVDESNTFGTVFAVLDGYPVTPLHYLVIPYRHCTDYFAMTAEEKWDADAALVALRDRVLEQDLSISGFNVGWNCGRDAGQTVMHAHGHLIPRRMGDVEEPRGGVRAVIPDKQRY